jgi:translation initiation factor 2 alpha subunit (eIF-2alpha)
MPLEKPILKSGIQTLLTEMRTKEENADEYFADQLATLIDTYIKSATVTVAAGIAVTTSAGAGATTAPGMGTIG